MSGIHTTYKYKITNDPAFMDEVYGTTLKIREILNGNYPKLSKKSTIEKLLNDIEKYPTIPQFKQQLASAYMLQKLPIKANECNNWLYKEHPTYLYALLNKANECYIANDYEGMKSFLGEDLQLESLYPNRKEFHKEEIMNYLSACAIYINATNLDDEETDTILNIMEGLDEDSKVLKRTIKNIENFNNMSFQKRMEELGKYEKQVKTVFVQSVPKTKKAPTLELAIFNKLYEYDAEIDHSIIKEILQLPQPTIKAECQKIIDDSIARFYYFDDEDNWDKNTFFVVHAIFILGETGNEENLPLLLQILKQSEDYCDLYFNEILTEKVWQAVYKISKNNIDALFSFLREPNIFTFCKTTIATVLEQYVLSDIIDKKVLIDEYANLLSFYFQKKDDNSIIDTMMVAYLISFLVGLKVEEKYPLIEKMYEEKLVSVLSIGTFNDIKNFKKDYPLKDADVINTIYEIYDELVEWKANDGDEYLEEDEFEDTDYEEVLPVRTEPKIGRNDPCPCGSEKKFKKCCLDKGVY